MLAEMEFSAPLIGADERAELLADAAGILDRRTAKLGGGRAKDTPEGQLARAFAQDSATLGVPEVHRLDDEHVVRKGVPVTREELVRLAGYYWMSLPVALWTGTTHAFNRLEVHVTLGNGDSGTQPRVINALPEQELATRFALVAGLSASVRGDLSVQVGLPGGVPLDVVGIPAELGAKAALTGKADSKLVLGPFDYAVRSAVVARMGMGTHECCWRLERASFADENDPGLRLIVQVPRENLKLHVSAQLLATRYTTFMGDGFMQALASLPAKFREFFTGGTPIAATGTWNLSDRL